MHNITSSSSTLGAAAAAGVTITAVPKSPHSELASTDNASVLHASSPTAIVSQPFAVATPATVLWPAAGEKPTNPACPEIRLPEFYNSKMLPMEIL